MGIENENTLGVLSFEQDLTIYQLSVYNFQSFGVPSSTSDAMFPDGLENSQEYTDPMLEVEAAPILAEWSTSDKHADVKTDDYRVLGYKSRAFNSLIRPAPLPLDEQFACIFCRKPHKTGKWYYEIVVQGFNDADPPPGSSQIITGLGRLEDYNDDFLQGPGYFEENPSWGIMWNPDVVPESRLQGYYKYSDLREFDYSLQPNLSYGYVIGWAIDMDGGEIWAQINGLWLGNSPSSGPGSGIWQDDVDGVFDGVNEFYPMASFRYLNEVHGYWGTTGGPPFYYTPPAGFSNWGNDS